MDGVSRPGRVLDPQALQAVSGFVAPALFGGNLLFDRDRVDEGGTFAKAASQLGLTTLRYPGGSITEFFFDIRNPDATSAVDPETGQSRPVMPLSEFLAFASETGMAPLIVLPTRPALLPGAPGARLPDPTYLTALRGFVRDVLEGRYGAVDIYGFEVGNEYWGSGRMTATEYGRLADAYALLVQDEIDRHRSLHRDDDWVEPKISVQLGQAGAFSTEVSGWQQNGQIIAALSPEARAAIDAVVGHFYSRVPYEELWERDWIFDRMDVWPSRAGLEHVEYHLTEWNVSRHTEHEVGVQYSAHMLAMFSKMVARGADAAWVWPIQQNTGTELSRNEGNPELTHMGQVFARFSGRVKGGELVGVDLKGPYFGVQHYRTEVADVLYVASRSAQEVTVTLDPALFGAGFAAGMTSASVTVMGYHGDPFARQPVPEFRIHSGIDPGQGRVEFTLAPWEIAEVVLTYGANGVSLAALLVETPVAGVRYSERLVGTPHDDLLRGGSGNDTLIGGRGNDTLYGERGDNELHGGPGDDLIFGGTGNDLIRGGPGNDTIHAGGGDNVIHGDEGDDLILGGPGNDTIYGGPGNDTIFGGAGDNVINAGRGHDVVYGGPGADVFVFRPGHETMRVMDFDPSEGDVLRLDPGLWGGAARTPLAVVEDFARLVQGRHVALEFPTQDAILLHGFADLDALAAGLQFL